MHNKTSEAPQPLGTSTNPFERGSVLQYLELTRQRDTETFLAFWLTVGSDLNQLELQHLRWENFSQDLRTVRGFLIAGEGAVEASIATEAVEAIKPLAKLSGLVLEQASWPRNLQMFWRLSDAPDAKAFREFLQVEDARRTRRRATRKPPINAERNDVAPAASAVREFGGYPSADEIPAAVVPTVPVLALEKPQPPPTEPPKVEPPKAKRPRCVTTYEAAAEISLSARWVKDKIKAGELKGYRMCGRWMVDCADFERFLADRSVGGRKEAV